MNLRTLSGLACVLVITAAPAGAGSVTFGTTTLSFTTPSLAAPAAVAAEAAFLAGLSGVQTESFEAFGDRFVATTIHSPLVGSFQQVQAGATGGACRSLAAGCVGLAVLNAGTSPFSGRFPMSDSASRAAHWLDSNDSKVMVFTVKPGYSAVGFFLTDPNDAGGTLAVQATDGGLAPIPLYSVFSRGLGSGLVSYVSIENPAGIESIRFWSNAENDGFGIDRVSVGSPVPEPTGLLLLGAGLLGLAALRRRRRV